MLQQVQQFGRCNRLHLTSRLTFLPGGYGDAGSRPAVPGSQVSSSMSIPDFSVRPDGA